MPALTPVAKTSLRWIIRLAVMLGVIYLLLAAVRSCNCLTEVHQTITGLSGFDFEISEIDCAFIGSNPSMNVFVSKTGQSWLTKEKTLLFEYSGGVDLWPVITPVDQHTIQISTPRIGGVLFRLARWEDLSINYDIAGTDQRGISEIVSFGRQVAGSDLVGYVRREILDLLAKGAKPITEARDGVHTLKVVDYGNTPDAIADAIIAEWLASGQDSDPRGLWLADREYLDQLAKNHRLADPTTPGNTGNR